MAWNSMYLNPDDRSDEELLEEMGNATNIDFEENTRRWNAEYELKQRALDMQHSAARQSARTASAAAAADKWYKQQSIELARERLAQDKYEFEQNLGLNRAKLGYGLIETAASLRGPENYYVAADFARGVAGQPQTAAFLQALRDNTKLSDFNMQGGVPQPETLNSLAAKLTGTNSAGNAAYDNNNLALIGNIAAKGPHQLGPGSLEHLTDTERKLFTAGLDELGYDTPTFLQGYARSRIGQGLSASRVA